MSASTVDEDLILCHQEPIRRPGAIQPHGALLALEGASLTIVRASASLEPLLGHAVETVLGRPLATPFGETPARTVRTAIETLGTQQPLDPEAGTGAPDPDARRATRPGSDGSGRSDTGSTGSAPAGTASSGDGEPPSCGKGASAVDAPRMRSFTLELEVRGERRRCDASVHRADGLAVLEIDNLRSPVPPDEEDDPTISLDAVQRLVRRLHAARTVQALCDEIVREVRELSGFDRVMIYRFHEDDHGEVVAESVVDAWPPYLGLHYPESDIPVQARELYRRNWIRCIAAVPYAPSPILPVDAEPLDLGFAHLRAVSPIHVEYLCNMGVGASMSISLLDGDRLWGLIACHHRSARHVPAAARTACELLGTTFSLLLPSLEAMEAARLTTTLRDVERRLIDQMASSVPFVDGAFDHLPNLADLVAADGVASISDTSVRTMGATPGEEPIAAFAAWLDRSVEENVFASARLAERYPEAAHWPDDIAGALVIEISRARGQYLMAFRRERVHSVTWAGRPDEKHVVESEDGRTRRLAPRRSFALWEESVRGSSLPWKDIELRCAETFRRTTLGLIVGMTEEVMRLNLELERSRDDLRSFAHIAAHDLKEPLRGINNYVAFLFEDHGSRFDTETTAKIETIARLADRGSHLTEALLEFAEVGERAIEIAPFALGEVVDEVLDTFSPTVERLGAQLSVDPDLPTIVGRRVHMHRILLNLVGNALKYAGDAPPRIAIEVEPGPTRADTWIGGEHLHRRSHVVRVRDHGIGIAPEHRESVFRLFKRLPDEAQGVQGNGLGLTIVRRIVELDGGRIELESEPGVGSTFSFTFGEPVDPA